MILHQVSFISYYCARDHTELSTVKTNESALTDETLIKVLLNNYKIKINNIFNGTKIQVN